MTRISFKHWPAIIAAIVFTLYLADAAGRNRPGRHFRADPASLDR